MASCSSTKPTAIDILGLDWNKVAAGGVYGVTGAGYFDMGYMANHIGPSPAALRALRDAAAKPELVSIYPPDCMPELKALVADKKFGRKLGADFEVLGVEGAQGGIGYTYLTFLDPGDEVIVTDPGYFHFVPAAELCGAKVVPISLSEDNGFRLHPNDVRAAISARTKMIVVCDPLNPFGTVQTREELLEIAAIAREHDIIVFNNITHNTHRTDPDAIQIPMTSLHGPDTDMSHVISVSGVSKGYGMPALRVGFMTGHPDLIRGAFLTKMELTKIHINYPGQFATIAAMKDSDYLDRSTYIIRRNYVLLKAAVDRTPGLRIPVKPSYGFCTVLDVSGTGVTAQEITVGLLNHRIAVIPGDGLGDVGAAQYLRINYSSPDPACVEQFGKALPLAIAEAQEERYIEAVDDFFAKVATEQGNGIRKQLAARLTGAAIAAAE